MKTNPCSVCGGTELNLIDGFYYCVECGTQDVNAQETVVEHTILADGTFAHTTSRKINTVLKDAIEMSGEWHKWHAFNFILLGLVEELMALGASESFRDRVLLIWTRYMNEFMLKDQMRTLSEVKQKEQKEHKSILFDYEDESEESIIQEEACAEENEEFNKKRKTKTETFKNSVKIITKGIIISILYIALNQDKSSIQLSHIYKFINEGRLSIKNCIKFVPKELDLNSIPHWPNFVKCFNEYDQLSIRQISMTLIKVLKLENPVVPDLRNIIDNIVKELCLPKDFKNLVLSLMLKVPCDYLNINSRLMKKCVLRIPDYEGVLMSYVLVALKMCFGLDDEYEILLSDTVEKINDEENRLKSYKLGTYSDPSDRLFSFREWSNYMQYRETLLCKHYLPMSQKYNLDIDDQVFMAHLEERKKNKKIPLSDEVTMDILNKILPLEERQVIPRSEFKASLTPLANHSEVILQYIQDPEIKLLISEDFSQYSLKYACRDFKLIVDGKNIIKGVSKDNKIHSSVITGILTTKKTDFTMVYVRNCENRNWLKTNPPTLEHITKIREKETDKDSDHGYDSNLENNILENNADASIIENEDEPIKLETIEEEKEGVSIFDDAFDDVTDVCDDKNEIELEPENDNFDLSNRGTNLNASTSEDDFRKSINDETSYALVEFNPDTFDREETIKELILAACEKHKIPIPKEYNPKEPVKRKSKLEYIDETGETRVKKRKIENPCKRGEAQKEIDDIMTAYYANMEEDLLNKVSEHIKSVANDLIDLGETQANGNISVANFDDSIINESKSKSSVDMENVSNIDSSVVEITDKEINIEDLLPKINPNFDEKTHDTKQLYIRYSQGLQYEDILEIDDPKIAKILERKIGEYSNDSITICEKDSEQQLEKETANSKITNSTGKEPDKKKVAEDDDIDVELLGPLIKNQAEIKGFKYWLRHYASETLRKNVHLKNKFDVEMKENFPKSFAFVINQCAAVLDCSACNLYKHMENLERSIFNFRVRIRTEKKITRIRRSRNRKKSDETSDETFESFLD